jgi:hypothetical protein
MADEPRSRCFGQCKSQRTQHFTPEVLVFGPMGWRFLLHDLDECPDRVKWHMNSLMEKAKAMRNGR